MGALGSRAKMICYVKISEVRKVVAFCERGLHCQFMDPNANSGPERAVYLEPYTEYNRKMDKGGVRELSESAWFPIWLADIYTGYMDPLAIEYQQGGEILTNEADDLYNRIFS